MQSRPIYAFIAICCALLPLPAMKLLERLNQGCGDGLCGFFSGLLVLGCLAVATGVFLFKSARRSETPAALRLIPPALWVMAFVPLFL